MAAHYTMVWGVARYDKYFSNTVNSLIATTSRKRPPPESDHFTNNPLVFQSKTVSKTLS